MLTVQPLKNTSFTRQMTPEEIRERMEYEEQIAALRENQMEFENIAGNDEFKFPKIAKKAVECGSIIAAGTVSAVATGYGAKTAIKLWKKMLNSSAVISFKNYANSAGRFVKEAFKGVKTKFLESDIYKISSSSIKNRYEKFGKTDFGKPIVKIFKNLGENTKKVYTGIIEVISGAKKRINAVKPETYEKAIVNAFSVSGGGAAAITAIKEKSEAKANAIDD